MAYTKEDLKKHLLEMGLNGTETIMIHSSMKAIGEVEGGVDTVVDSLMEFFQDGLLLTPTHTWRQMSDTYNVFDPDVEPACVGLIPNTFMKRKEVVRSLHPTHSIAAFGKRAKEYIKGEENMITPCPPGGCWDRLREENAKILLLGVTHIKNTYIHSIEEVYDVEERLTKEPTTFYIKMPDGSMKMVGMHRHYNEVTTKRGEEISDNFDKMKEGYFNTGAAKQVCFGDAQCILCDAAKLFEVTGKILEKDSNCFVERASIPKEWYL